MSGSLMQAVVLRVDPRIPSRVALFERTWGRMDVYVPRERLFIGSLIEWQCVPTKLGGLPVLSNVELINLPIKPIDTDIENIHPRFILGIVAPFLFDSEVILTKGYYRRPKGDARVTEILARPFLNMLFPEAADFIQPLAGEYAGTRKFLERATFYSGYSVEVAILLQAVLEYNSKYITQVFLDQRVHPLQDVPSLGKMAGNILYTLLHMAHRYKRLTLNMEVTQQIKVFNAIIGNNQQITSETVSVADTSLPIVIDLPNYRSRTRV